MYTSESEEVKGSSMLTFSLYILEALEGKCIQYLAGKKQILLKLRQKVQFFNLVTPQTASQNALQSFLVLSMFNFDVNAVCPLCAEAFPQSCDLCENPTCSSHNQAGI